MHVGNCHVRVSLALQVFFLAAQLAVANAQQTPASPLTSEQMRKINWLLDKAGTVELNPDLTHALALTQGNQKLTVRQLSVGNSAGWGFYWNRMPNSSEVLLLMTETDDTVHAYLLSSDFRIRNTLLAKPNKGPVAIPNDVAHAELARNLRIWARYADQKAMQ